MKDQPVMALGAFTFIKYNISWIKVNCQTSMFCEINTKVFGFSLYETTWIKIYTFCKICAVENVTAMNIEYTVTNLLELFMVDRIPGRGECVDSGVSKTDDVMISSLFPIESVINSFKSTTR